MKRKLKNKAAVIVFAYYPRDTRVRRETEAILDLGIKADVICLRRDQEPLEEDYDGIHVYRFSMKKSRPAMIWTPTVYKVYLQGFNQTIPSFFQKQIPYRAYSQSA